MRRVESEIEIRNWSGTSTPATIAEDAIVTELQQTRRFRFRSSLVLWSLLSTLIAGCASVAHAPAVNPPHTSQAVEPETTRRVSPPRVYGDMPVPFQPGVTEAYLVDVHSGTALYAYNADTQIQPGSLAKLMTFYIALNALSSKRISLTSTVTIGQDAAALAQDPTLSRMFLQVGQQVTFEDLLYGMMVHSGCDAALAIADYLAGDGPTFVAQMNSEAERLGMTNTHFTQPNGLPERGEYTSAHDMVILALAVIRDHPEATTYTACQRFSFNGHDQGNTNGLLFVDARVLGLKTGHIKAAGFHLVAFARDGDDQFVSGRAGRIKRYQAHRPERASG